MEILLLIAVILVSLALTILWVILPVVVFRMNQKMDRVIRLLERAIDQP